MAINALHANEINDEDGGHYMADGLDVVDSFKRFRGMVLVFNKLIKVNEKFSEVGLSK